FPSRNWIIGAWTFVGHWGLGVLFVYDSRSCEATAKLWFLAALPTLRMSNTLDYGRRPSRRHWRVLAVALVLAGAAFLAMRSWRAYSARLEDRRLMLQQQKYRQDFDPQV